MDKLSQKHHMTIPWHNLAISEDDVPAVRATLEEKSAVIGRVGIMMLAVGTGAWRVRDSMNTTARTLGVTCAADVGLMTIEFTCIEGSNSFTQALSLPTSGVNTDRLSALEEFVREFPEHGTTLSVGQIHATLDTIEKKPGLYKPLVAGLAAAIACCAFTFLLGGGPIEMICAFLGAGFGNWLRRRMLDKKLALVACITASVAFACCVYVGSITLAEHIWGVSSLHEAGYICSMLFVIPGFPLITGGLDVAKLDMRSGLERLAYATMIITVATLVGWATAVVLHFQPADFVPLELGPVSLCLLRMAASFFGVYGFSLMFNSPRRMAALAGCIGAIANPLRLELVDLAKMPIGAAALIGALAAGLLASLVGKRAGFPRISLTVPSIVIMVPGLYMYRGIYYIALNEIGAGGLWLSKAVLIVLALPLGLFFARVLSDPRFRHCS